MLNIGGIGNFTFLPGSVDASKVFVTDTGPGNTLIDQAVQKHRPGVHFDKDSKIAKSGKVNQKLLEGLSADKFFQLPFPKTTGPDYLYGVCAQGYGTYTNVFNFCRGLARHTNTFQR